MNKVLDIVSIPGPNEFKSEAVKNYIGGIELISLNNKKIQSLNPDYKIIWHLGFRRIDWQDNFLNYKNKNFQFIPYIFDESELTCHYKKQPSSQHGSLLNLVISQAIFDSNQVVIIDPDFFIFETNWIEKVISEIQKEKIIFYGASYPEQDPRYFMDFPTAYFMIIDKVMVDIKKLDFMPDEKTFVRRLDENFDYGFDLNTGKYPSNKFLLSENDRLLPLKKLIMDMYRWRRKKHTFRDTGWKIRVGYKHKFKHKELYWRGSFEIKVPTPIHIDTNSKTLGNIFKKNPTFFDPIFYLETYNDVRNSGMDPYTHFKLYGLNEGRYPSAISATGNTRNVVHFRQYLNTPLRHLDLLLSSYYSIRPNTYKTFKLDASVSEKLAKLGYFHGAYFTDRGLFGVHLGHAGKQMSFTEIEKQIQNIII